MTTLCRWVGSKKDVIGQIFAHIPKAQGRFIVPFLGAGSDAFHADERQTSILQCCFIDCEKNQKA
jgi:site-specific DNA-adenine methylase